ncbi:hypothetical protein KEM56_002751 [Ascosphaera pollenicola]|nr:hypothetical protein KEM56_002751 [Ascosphaera pollenicola]
MSVIPLITFKAGLCDIDTSVTPNKVKAKPEPGYIYLYEEDEITHFCWRRRSAPADQPEIDLFMVPGDGSFVPYRVNNNSVSPTNGRIFVLKFSSSSQRYLFYLQSQSQHEDKDPSFWSERDLRIGHVVNSLLQGDDVNMAEELLSLRHPGADNDDDETMEDVEGHGHDHEDTSNDRSGAGGTGSAGGAGPDATGGDIREEGEGSREGGADGGRAAASGDPNEAVQNLLRSLQGGSFSQQRQQSDQSTNEEDEVFTTLPDLLTPASTIPVIEAADVETVETLLSFLPPSLLRLPPPGVPFGPEADAGVVTLQQKKDVLTKVLRSPQFSQSLSSLTNALREGGLPSISEALHIPVESGGYVRRGGVPLGNGPAVRVFLEGVKKSVSEEADRDGGAGADDQMQTD